MTKLSELLERRAAALDTMKEHQEAGGEPFDKAEAEFKALDQHITRAREIEVAERAERGQPLSGDSVLETEIRSKFSLSRAIAGAAGLPGVDWGFEREMQVELAKRAGKSPEGVFVPTELFENCLLYTSPSPRDS